MTALVQKMGEGTVMHDVLRIHPSQWECGRKPLVLRPDVSLPFSPFGRSTPDRVITETHHPVVRGRTFHLQSKIFDSEREFMVHTVPDQDIIGLSQENGPLVGQSRIVLRSIGVPFLHEIMIAEAYLIQACPVRDSNGFRCLPYGSGGYFLHQNFLPLLQR